MEGTGSLEEMGRKALGLSDAAMEGAGLVNEMDRKFSSLVALGTADVGLFD